MNLDFTDEQKEIKASLSKMLAERCNMSEVRRVLNGSELNYHRGVWNTLSELGWLSAAIPEVYGGLGLGYVVLCGVAEELGRVLAPVPVLSSIYLAAEIILALGSDAQKAELLPKLASGEVIGTFAMWEGAGPMLPNVNTRFEHGRIYGHKSPVLDGQIAHMSIVAAKSGRNDHDLFIVNLEQPEIERVPLHNIDPTRPSAQLIFSGARGEPLGQPAGRSNVRRALDRAAVLCAFEQIGAAQSALDAAVKYASVRHAFGRPIGSFQAIKHRLADVYIQNELAKSNAYHAAWALEEANEGLPAAAAAARISAIRAFELASRESLHVHGGIGMTWESDCHIFYRRSRHLAVALGGAADWKDELIGLVQHTAASARGHGA